MTDWRTSLELSRPFWGEYCSRLQNFNGARFPDAKELNKLLAVNLESHGGQRIRFVPARDLPGIEYEYHIYTTGQVSTRENNWHDLFNALAWSCFPQLKVAMNSVHFNARKPSKTQSRGKVRDALTLLDESGAIVVSSNADRLDAYATHDWSRVFLAGESHSAASELGWQNDDTHVFVCGHALLEKFLKPYKAITAHALLVLVDDEMMAMPRETLLSELDRTLAKLMVNGQLLDTPGCLSPLPVMGIPGWWPHGAQDSEFYADRQVFRLPREGRQKAPIINLVA